MKPGKDSSKSPRPASLSVSSVRSLGNFENRINALLKYNDGQPWFDASGNRPTPADVYNISVKLETTTGNLEWCLIPARQLGATIFPDKSLVLQFYIACPFSSNNTIYIKVSFDVNAQRVKVTLGIDYDLNPGVNSRIYLEGIASDAGPIPGLVSDWIQDPDSTYRLKLLLDGGKTRIALFPKDAKPKDPLDPNLPCQQDLRDDKSGRHSFQIDAMLPFTTWSKEWNDRVNAIVVGPMEALSPPAAFSFTPIFDGVKKSISSVTSFSLIDNGSQSTPYKIRLQSLIVAPGQELTVTFPRLLASKPHLLPLHGILVTTDPTTNLPVRSPSAGTPEPPPTVQVRGAVKLDNRNSDWFSLGSLTFCPPNPSQPGDCFFGYYTGAQDDNKGHFRHRSGVFALSQVSVASAQLDPLREVEETLLLIAEPLQGAFELAYDEERVGYGEPHSVTLNLKHAPTPSGQLPSIPASIIALSASPLLVARITYQVANSDAASRIIANWSTDIIGSDWSWKSDPAQPVITLSLPPQTVDEKIHVIRGDYEPEDYLAFSFCRRADFNLTWLDTASQFGTAPWALGELLGYSGQRSPGARLISLASEFMAGVSIDATPRQMRLLELSALLGRCAPVNRAENSFAVYWRKLGKRYNSRPAVLIPQREFESALTTSLTAAADNLRFTLKVTDSDLTGSLQHLIDSSNIRDLLVSRPVSELARLDGARHTSLGGSGRGDGVFAGNSTVSMTMGMGRLEKLVVTREGRIGIFGHRARHVVIGARALVPTEQFVDYQDPLLGQAMVRKTEEYVEIEPLKQYGTLDKLSLGPVQAVEFGTTRGNFVRIPVDSRWGSDFTLANAGKPIKGWKIPLWQRGLKPTVYPRPALHFHLAKAESSAAFPVENVELVHFYTLTDGVNDSIDTWPQLPGIDGLTPDKALAETALPGIDDHPVPDSYHEPFTFFFLGGTEPVNLLHGRSDEIVSTELQSITVACNVDPLKANPFTLQSRFPRASQVSSSPAFDLRKNARRALASLAATSHTLAFLRIDSAVAMRIAAAAPGPADFLLDACVSAAQQQQGAWSPPLLADSSKVPQIILKLRKKNEFQKDRFLKQAVEYYRLLAKATDPLNKVKKQTLRQAKQALERLSVEYDHLARHFPYCKSQALKLARTAYLNCVQKYADAAYAVTQGSRLQDTLNALIHELQGLEKSLSANWVPFLWGHPDRYYFENFLVESIAIRRDLFALAGTSSAGMEDTLKKILGLEKVTLDGLQSLILAYRAADSTPFQQKTAILAALEKAYDDAETAVEDGTVFSPPSENDIAASYDNPTDSPNVLQAQEIQ